MIGAKITLPNGRRFAIVARSGSHTICWQSLPQELQTVPEGPIGSKRWHPISVAPGGAPIEHDEKPFGLCCMVRDPIERFRSSCARQKVSVEEGLTLTEWDVHFWSLKFMGLHQEGVTHFRFPDQLNDCAEWLGLPTPVPQLNEESDSGKPTLTADQEIAVRTAYADDIALWDSLQPSS
jgi:hypothetical protein